MITIESRLPEVVGEFKLHPSEFCYVVYMPIKIGHSIQIPDNLKWVKPLVDNIHKEDYKYFRYWYWYLTVKHMWVPAKSFGNRAGWHIDGYGSDDINYIWYDSLPTQFALGEFTLSEGHSESLKQMAV